MRDHARAGDRWRSLVLALSAVVLLSSCGWLGDTSPAGQTPGVTSSRASESPSSPDRVTEDGLSYEQGVLSFSADAGVAAPGTRVVVSTMDAPELSQTLGTVLEGSAFSVEFDGGQQPASPVSVSVDVSDSDELSDTVEAESELVFLTRPDESSPWEGQPATMADGRVTALMSHFSEGLFVRASRPGLVQALSSYLKLTRPKPSCVGQKAESGGRTFTVAAKNPKFVYPCVEVNDDGDLVVTLHSNSPNVWLVRGDPGASTPRDPETGPGAVSALTVLAHDASIHPDNETILVAGESASFTVGAGTEETYFDLQISPAYGMLDILWNGVIMWLGVSDAASEWLAVIGGGQCLSDAMAMGETDTYDAQWLAGSAPGLIGCVTAALDAKGLLTSTLSLGLSMVGALPALLAAQVYGLYSMASADAGNVRVMLTSTVAGEGQAGGWPTSRSDSNGPLYAWLGAANAWGEVSVGFPDWLACADDTCIAGEDDVVSVIARGSTGFYEQAVFSTTDDARESLSSLGIAAKAIDDLLAPGE